MNEEKGDGHQDERSRDPQGMDLTEGGEAGMTALVAQMEVLNRRAEQEYSPIVEEILRSGVRDIRQIEQTLDGLLDFCGHPPVLALYRRLCRHYWEIDPAAAADYVRSYRERWDSDTFSE